MQMKIKNFSCDIHLIAGGKLMVIADLLSVNYEDVTFKVGNLYNILQQIVEYSITWY